jgi:hypothetical protein
MNSDHLIFVGVELTEKVVEQFATCHERDRVYLEDSVHLETIVIDGCNYIGKRAKDGISIDRLEDVARSVVSLIVRVAQEEIVTVDGVSIIPITEGGTDDEVDSNDDETSSNFDYSGLVD